MRVRLTSLLRSAGAAAGAFLLLVGADLAAGRGRLSADGFWDAFFFEAADVYRDGCRILGPGSELVLSGLWPGSASLVEIDVEVGRQKRAGVVPLALNDAPAVRMRVEPGETTWRFAAASDRGGRLELRLDGERWVRVREIRVVQQGKRRLPPRRLLDHAVLALVLWLAARACAGRWEALLCVAGAALCAASILAARLLALACLPWAAWAGAAGIAAWLLARRLALPVPHARFLAAAAALKLLVGTHPAIEQPDLVYHAHQAVFYQEGKLILGKYGVQERDRMLLIPYPPALYAALQPLLPSDQDEQDRVRAAAEAVRFTLPLLEATAPLLVFAIARAGGAVAAAAGAAAVAAAVMPEGLLVVLKCVAANVAGSFSSLLFLALVLARAGAPLLVAAAALAFLSHPGSAATLACLLPLWGLLEGRREGWRRPATVLAAALLGGALAWVLYYRATGDLVAYAANVLAGWGVSDAAGFFRVRFVHLGKIAQDLLLKFGGSLPLLAWIGLRRGGMPPPLAALVRPWLLVALAFAAASVLTPLSLRFEYFAAPAVALLAGFGAAQLEREGASRRVAWLWAFALLVQALLGAAALAGRLRLISLIIPSQSWPFPVL